MNKKWHSLLLVVLVLGGISSLHAGVVIDKIHYVPGDDFVQLHFQTSKVIIPDYFYPDKANLKHLVVRIKDAEIQADPASLRFESPVIEAVVLKKTDSYTDVDITLREEVNFRLFTNQGGLYIEFPVIRNLGQTAPQVVAAAAPPPAASPSQPLVAPARSLVSMDPGTPIKGRVQLKDVRMQNREGDRLRFEFDFSDKVSYRVIPIADSGAARLAIDLKNVQAKRLNQTIQQGSVRSLRGAYNTPTDYRIVFDLATLKHYTVQDQGAMLAVEFSERDLVTQAPAEAPASPVAEVAPVNELQAPEPVVVVAENLSPTPAAASEFFPAEKSKAEDAPLISGALVKETEQGEEVIPLKQNMNDTGKQFKGEPMTFTFKNTDLIDVLKAIGQISGLNIIVDPNVSGKVTCELVKVPWDQALDLFLRVNNLDMVQEGNILRIGLVTNLQREAEDRRKLREAKESEGKLQVFTRTLSYAKCAEVKPILDKQLSSRGEIVPDVRTNTLIISEVPDRIPTIDNIIDTLDAPIAQVSIEARIVEASSNALDTFGIQWGYNLAMDPAHGNQTSMKFPATVLSNGGGVSQTNPMGYAINLPVAESVVSPNVRLGNIANTFNLDVALSALTRKGKGRVISSPKMTTQNNKEANIVQGSKIPIQTNQNNTITTQYVNAALELKVTPQITARGSIMMEVDIKNDRPDRGQPEVNGMPTIATQSAKTSVLVNDGATLVIGGMMTFESSESSNGVPLLSKIPIFGGLFRSKYKNTIQKELIIFITPRIIK